MGMKRRVVRGVKRGVIRGVKLGVARGVVRAAGRAGILAAILRAVLAVVLAPILVLPAPAYADGDPSEDVIRSLAVDMQVGSDGVIQVTETYEWDFAGA